jgi:hypothetical protein
MDIVAAARSVLLGSDDRRGLAGLKQQLAAKLRASRQQAVRVRLGDGAHWARVTLVPVRRRPRRAVRLARFVDGLRALRRRSDAPPTADEFAELMRAVNAHETISDGGRVSVRVQWCGLPDVDRVPTAVQPPPAP